MRTELPELQGGRFPSMPIAAHLLSTSRTSSCDAAGRMQPIHSSDVGKSSMAAPLVHTRQLQLDNWPAAADR